MILHGLVKILTEFKKMSTLIPCDELAKYLSKFNSFQYKLDQRKPKVWHSGHMGSTAFTMKFSTSVKTHHLFLQAYIHILLVNLYILFKLKDDFPSIHTNYFKSIYTIYWIKKVLLGGALIGRT